MAGRLGSREVVSVSFRPRIIWLGRNPEAVYTLSPGYPNIRIYMPSVRLTPKPIDCWLWL